MDGAKIRLSEEEAALIGNAHWILTKNAILEKVKSLLARLQSAQQDWLLQHPADLPVEVIKSSPKISRGENYLGLPYLVLDQPRYFDKEDIFTIRSLFWWGNHFSVVLQLSGKYKKRYEQKISSSYTVLKEQEFFIGIGEDPWAHHFEENNYKVIAAYEASDFETIVHKHAFIKIAKKVSLKEWDNAEQRLKEIFGQLIHVLGD